MKPFLRFLAVLCGVLSLMLGVTWIVQGNDFFLYRVFGLRYEQTRREIFEASKAYRQGAVQELQNMRFEYEQASKDHKQALASIILHRAADYDPEILPTDLRQFIDGLKAHAEVSP